MFIWALFNTFHVKSEWDLLGAEQYPGSKVTVGPGNAVKYYSICIAQHALFMFVNSKFQTSLPFIINEEENMGSPQLVEEFFFLNPEH